MARTCSSISPRSRATVSRRSPRGTCSNSTSPAGPRACRRPTFAKPDPTRTLHFAGAASIKAPPRGFWEGLPDRWAGASILGRLVAGAGPMRGQAHEGGFFAVHVIQPARLKPGVSLDRLPSPGPSDQPGQSPGRIVRGRALVFWDSRTPNKKLDAIDTDQITPAADCVSESLDTLDARWKAGSFRYLM